MKALDQTAFGEQEGNCFQACMASLLEVPIETVPHFMVYGDRWCEVARNWCHQRGFDMIMLTAGGDYLPEGYWIAGGSADRGLKHACIYFGDQLAHDPHPDRTGLIDVEDITILLPFNPAGIMRKLPRGRRCVIEVEQPGVGVVEVVTVDDGGIIDRHPPLCECGRDWDDCSTRDNPEEGHYDR